MSGMSMRAVLALLVAIGAVGCQSTPTNRYTPDPSVTAETGATLYGSKQEFPNPFVKDLWINVSQIDGQQTWANWKEPILVAAGTHTVTISANRGSSFGGLATPFTFEAGKVYQLSGQANGAQRAKVWFEERGSGTPIGDQLALCFSRSVDPAAVGFLGAAIARSLDSCK